MLYWLHKKRWTALLEYALPQANVFAIGMEVMQAYQ